MWQLINGFLSYHRAFILFAHVLILLACLGYGLATGGDDKGEIAIWLAILSFLVWVVTFNSEQKEQRLVLHGALPVSKRQVALVRALMPLVIQLLTLVASQLLLLAVLPLRDWPWPAAQAHLLCFTGFLLAVTELGLVHEELNYRYRSSKGIVVALLGANLVVLVVFSLLLGTDQITLLEGTAVGGSFAFLVDGGPGLKLSIAAFFYLTAVVAGWWSTVLFSRRERFNLTTGCWSGTEVLWDGGARSA